MVDLSRRRLFAHRSVDTSQLHLPWIARPESFTDECTRCGRCREACEMKIIINGDGGFPTVNFQLDECTFCYQCAEVCPEPIFLPQTDVAWQARAVIQQEQCLAQQNVECRSCGETCGPMAIQFRLQRGRVAQPEIHIDDCTGCGACVSLCPTSAISVSNIE